MQKLTSNTTDVSNNNNIQEELKQYRDIDYSSESSRMRYLIKKNEEENIDFISTLIRLKGRNVYSNINPNEKLLPNIQQIGNSIATGLISYGNSNSNNKTEDESKSYIKEILDVCGSSGSTNVIGNDTFDIDNEINSITPRRIEPKKESGDNSNSNNVITNEINDINNINNSNNNNTNNDNLHKGELNKMFKEAEEIEKMLTQKQYLNSTNKKKTNVKVFSHKTDKYGIPISHSSKCKERNIHNNNNNEIPNEVKHSKTNTKSTIISNNNTDNSDTSSVVKVGNVSDKNDVEVVNNNNTQIGNDNDNNNNTNSKTIFNPDNNYFTNIIQEENIKLSVELSEKTQRKTKARIIETTEINLFDDDNDDITNNNNEIEQGKIQYNMIKQYPNIKESKTIAHIVNSVEPIEEKKIEIDLDDLLTPKYIFSSNASSLNNNYIHNINNNSNNNNIINKNISKHIIIQSHSSSALHASSSHQTNNNNENNNQFLRHVSKSFCSFIPPSHNEVNNNNNNHNNNTNGCLLSHKNEKKQQNEFETIQHQTNNTIKGNSTRPTTTKQQNQSLRKSQPIIKNTKKNADINKKTLSVIKKKKYKFEPLSRKRGTPAPQMKKQIFNININVNKSVKNPKVGKITINNTNKDDKKDVVKSSNISLDNYFKNIFSQEPSKKTNKLVKRTNNSRKGTVNATSKSSSSSKIISLLNTSENVAVDTITAYNNNINSHNNG